MEQITQTEKLKHNQELHGKFSYFKHFFLIHSIVKVQLSTFTQFNACFLC